MNSCCVNRTYHDCWDRCIIPVLVYLHPNPLLASKLVRQFLWRIGLPVFTTDIIFLFEFRWLHKNDAKWPQASHFAHDTDNLNNVVEVPAKFFRQPSRVGSSKSAHKQCIVGVVDNIVTWCELVLDGEQLCDNVESAEDCTFVRDWVVCSRTKP